MNQHQCGPGCGRWTLAQLQDLRDQYREEMDAKARRACEAFAAIGCVVVSVEPDDRVTHHRAPPTVT